MMCVGFVSKVDCYFVAIGVRALIIFHAPDWACTPRQRSFAAYVFAVPIVYMASICLVFYVPVSIICFLNWFKLSFGFQSIDPECELDVFLMCF